MRLWIWRYRTWRRVGLGRGAAAGMADLIRDPLYVQAAAPGHAPPLPRPWRLVLAELIPPSHAEVYEAEAETREWQARALQAEDPKEDPCPNDLSSSS